MGGSRGFCASALAYRMASFSKLSPELSDAAYVLLGVAFFTGPLRVHLQRLLLNFVRWEPCGQFCPRGSPCLITLVFLSSVAGEAPVQSLGIPQLLIGGVCVWAQFFVLIVSRQQASSFHHVTKKTKQFCLQRLHGRLGG